MIIYNYHKNYIVSFKFINKTTGYNILDFNYKGIIEYATTLPHIYQLTYPSFIKILVVTHIPLTIGSLIIFKSRWLPFYHTCPLPYI